MNIQPLMSHFRRFLRARDYAPRTAEGYYDAVWALHNGMAKRLHKPSLALEDLTRKRLQDYYDSMLQRRGVGTVQKHVAALRCFCKMLICRDLVTLNVGSLLLIPKMRRQRRPLLRLEDAMRILRAPMKHRRLSSHGSLQRLRDAAMLFVLYEGGLRASELTGLNVEHVYFDNPRKGACILQVLGKGRKVRNVVVIRSTKVLRQYLAERALLGTKEPALFLNFRDGGRIARTTVPWMVKKWAAAAGVTQHVHPHMFRAACATHMRWGGASRRAIQDHLGHESPTMTEWYCHASPTLVIDRGLVCHPLNQKQIKDTDLRAGLDTAMNQLAELSRQLDRKAA